MFLTRSKTSSALNAKLDDLHEYNNMLPLIPNDMIHKIEMALPSIELALKPILPEDASQLTLDMLLTWVAASRATAGDVLIVQKENVGGKKQTSTALRSWATRSFSVKRKLNLEVEPLKLQQDQFVTEISDMTPPSLANSISSASSSSSFSIGESQCLYQYQNRITNNGSTVNLLQDQDYMPLISKQSTVSMKSMIDLLDTPPLIPDDMNLSLIEESLTPLSSAFFNDKTHLRQQEEDSDTDSEYDGEEHLNIYLNNNEAALGATIQDKNNTSSVITTISSTVRDAKSIRKSISTMFNQLGSSVKKVLFNNSTSSNSVSSSNKNGEKKKTSNVVSKLGRALSVQNNLSAIRKVSPLPRTKITHSYTSLAVNNEPKRPADIPKTKSYVAGFASFLSTGKIDNTIANTNGGKVSPNILPSSTSIKSENEQESGLFSFDKLTTQNSGWDNDSTQSQQFDKLLGDIWEQTQEYQEYFTTEEQQKQDGAMWSPRDDIAVKTSKTESNVSRLAQDEIQYVCVGRQLEPIAKRLSTLSAERKVNLGDIKTYKRSTSAYSNIKDYDIKWQASFHEDQKSREKVCKTLKSVSWAFYNIMQKNHRRSEFTCDPIFDENESSILEESSPYYDFSEPLTEWSDIFDQLAYVFDCGELTSEHAIITFIYAKRMLDSSQQKMWDSTWRMIIMSALLTAVKVWDDCAIFNADFAMIFPELTLEDINSIERVFLSYLEWDVSVNCSEFAKAYFYLREIEQNKFVAA